MYGFTTTLTGTTFDQALAKTTAALKAEGFGVLSDIENHGETGRQARGQDCGRALEVRRPKFPRRPGSEGPRHLGELRVIALSGDNFSGRASASTGGYYSRAIVSFDLAARTLEWRSSDLYTTQPAMAHGLVFAGSNAPLRLSALNESDGTVAWSWTPPEGASQFCRNVIVTDTHVLVSTDRAVHAIDLATRQSVWSASIPGELALSGRGT